MSEAVVDTIQIVSTQNKAVSHSGTIVSSGATSLATFRSNDFQVVPRYTQFDISINSVPELIQAAIALVDNSLQAQINADRVRLDAVDNGTNTQLVLIKNANTQLTGEFNTYKAATDTALAGIIVDYLTKTEATAAEAAQRLSLLSEISAEYLTQANASQSFYTKAETDGAIATANTLLTATLNGVDAKYSEAIDVTVDAFGVAKSQKIENLVAENEARAELNLDVNGYITGYAISNYGVPETSSFDVITGNFRVSNGITTAAPFSISGTDIVFNGKVSFNSVTGTENVIQNGDNLSLLTNDAGFTDDTAALAALAAAQAAQNTADGAIRTYYQAAAPTGLNNTTDVGDMWFDTDDGQAYRWSGTAWVIIEDNSIAVALSAAQNAQATADGKITTFYQATAPTADSIGDIWIETDNGNLIYIWTGTVWDSTGASANPQDVVDAINAGTTTTIDGGKITAGTITSNAFYGNVIYNLVGGVPATEATYTMKIDLAAGEVHIK